MRTTGLSQAAVLSWCAALWLSRQPGDWSDILLSFYAPHAVLGAAALLVRVNDHPPACSQGLRRILRAAAETTGGIFGVHLLLLWELPLGELGMGGQALAVYILSGLLVWLAQRVWSWLPRATPPSFLGDF